MITALVNHLWQSTAFAAVAGLLALTLRNNRAAVRHGLWLAGSLKFLVPFAVLIAIGSHISWRSLPQPAGIERTSQPLAPLGLPAAAPVLTPAAPERASHWTAILFALWAGGFAVGIVRWFLRWRRIQRAVRTALPVALTAPIDVRCSPSLLEPGVFGIFHPVLLLPEGITKRLEPEELRAILAHELCHVRRRDNLTAALHMAVEAIFWFHPLVWWIGMRLVDERERACDEWVLQSGAGRQAYASSILKVCRFYVESPLTCAAGATGANLGKRIEAIMTHRAARKLCPAKKLLLAGAGAAALAAPVAVGMINAPPLRAQPQPQPRLAFEAASIKESKSADPRNVVFQFLPGGRFISRNLPLIFVVAGAYDFPFLPDRFTGGPDWIRRDPYDIEATAPGGAIPSGMSAKDRNEKIRLMLQALLADRFHLVIHSELRDLPRYSIVVAKGGPKLEKAKVEEKDCAENPSGPDDPAACHIFTGGQGRGLHGQAVSLADLVRGVSGFTDRPVVDQTGLSGLFNIQTEGWVPMRPRPPRPPGQEPTAEDLAFADPARPTLFQIFDRLGLKLDPERGPVEIFVIESVSKPSEN